MSNNATIEDSLPEGPAGGTRPQCDYKALEAEFLADQRLLTLTEVAARLRCRRKAVREMLTAKQIPCIQRGSRRYVRLGDLRRFLDKHALMLPAVKQTRGPSKKKTKKSKKDDRFRPDWLDPYI